MIRAKLRSTANASTGQADRPLLSWSHVTLRYENGALGLDDMTLSIESGRTYAVVGPLASGKTSLMRAAAGFLRGESVRIAGSIQLSGTELVGTPIPERAELGLVFVPERQKLVPGLTGEEHLRMVAGHRVSQARDEVLELFPRLRTVLDRPAAVLSGGQRQMLAVGIAISRSWRVLLIDEPFLGLTPALRAELAAGLRRIFEVGGSVADPGRALIVTAEKLDQVEWADSIAMLHRGALKPVGPR
jgi:ABC-type branched-subunit amino acid transport system ATPase component